MVMSGKDGLELLAPSAKYPTTHTHKTDGDQVTSVRRLVLEEIFWRVGVHTDRQKLTLLSATRHCKFAMAILFDGENNAPLSL